MGPWTKYGGASQPTRIMGPPKEPTPRSPEAEAVARAQAAAAPYQTQKAMADAETARTRAAMQAHLLKRAQQGPQLSPKDAAAMRKRNADMEALTGQVRRVGDLYRQNFKGGWREKGPGVLAEYLDATPTSERFNSAAAGLEGPFISAFRVPGVGPQSNLELEAFINANQPSNDDTDARVEEKLDNIMRRVNARRKEMGLPSSDWRPQQKRQQSLPQGWSIKRVR